MDGNRRVLLARVPRGLPVPGDFGRDTVAVPSPRPGQFLSRTLWLSLDPNLTGEIVVVKNGLQEYALSDGQGVRRVDPSLAPVSIRGLVVYDHFHRMAEMQTVIDRWIREGRFRYREDVTDGLEQAPAAFCRLMQGDNFGKTLARVAAAT